MKKNTRIIIGIILVLIIIGVGTFVYTSDYATKISLDRKLKILEKYECISIPCEDSPVITLSKKESELRNKKLGIKTNKEEYLSEEENIKIDEYNFKQLERVKSILDGLEKDSYSFENLKEFNEKFNQNIEPIKNCYLLSNGLEKGKENYMFMFKLYSKDYVKKHKSIYYVYPETLFQEIENGRCNPHGGECGGDMIFERYLETISNPCHK